MKQNNIAIFVIISIFIILCSCSKMNSLHQEYLDEGEKIYAARVDSCFARSGDNRQQIDVYYSAQRIVRGVIYWNLQEDSIEFDLPSVCETFYPIMIPKIDEGDYTYNLITYDKYGNASLPLEFIGQVHGENYKNSLSNKRILDMYLEDENGMTTTVIEWGITENAYGMILKYITKDGVSKDLIIPEEELETRISDNILGSDFSYSTYYKPNENSIDIYQTEYKTMTFPL